MTMDIIHFQVFAKVASAHQTAENWSSAEQFCWLSCNGLQQDVARTTRSKHSGSYTCQWPTRNVGKSENVRVIASA